MKQRPCYNKLEERKWINTVKIHVKSYAIIENFDKPFRTLKTIHFQISHAAIESVTFIFFLVTTQPSLFRFYKFSMESRLADCAERIRSGHYSNYDKH